MPASRNLKLTLGVALAIAWWFPARADERQMRWIMGTLWEIEAEGPPAAVAAGFAEIRRLDALLSHYQPQSELSRLNENGEMAVAGEMADLLRRCADYSRQSQGAFDVTVAPLVEAWGFKHLDYRLPAPEAIAKAKATVGWRRIAINGNAVRLTPGTRLELGAIGKGYALDRALAAMRPSGGRRIRLDAGGQQLVAGDWRIGIRHPRKPGALLGRLSLKDGWSVATSADDERGFEHNGRRYGHVIDPRSGWPAEAYPSVTVIAPSAELADMLSTTSTVLGPDASHSLLRHYKAEALWYKADGTLHQTPGFVWEPAGD